MNEMLLIIKGLSQNVFLFIALSFAYSLLLTYSRKTSSCVQGLIYGVTFSIIAGLGMMMNIELMPGSVIDGRILMVGLCGAYGGPLAEFISVVIVSGFRASPALVSFLCRTSYCKILLYLVLLAGN